MNTVKNRSITLGQEVEVYFNLHKHLFSIRDRKTKLVLAHSKSVLLHDVTFKVSQKLREKVIAEQRKNVHAFVVGKFAGTSALPKENLSLAYYNPYRTTTFVNKKSFQPIEKATVAYLENKHIYYIN